MLYALHEAAYYAATPMRAAARLARDWWSSPLNPARNSTFSRSLSAGADLYENVTRRYGKPEWHIDEIQVNGHPVRVRQTVGGAQKVFTPRATSTSRIFGPLKRV